MYTFLLILTPVVEVTAIIIIIINVIVIFFIIIILPMRILQMKCYFKNKKVLKFT